MVKWGWRMRFHYIEEQGHRQTHKLRRVPGKASADSGGGNSREHRMELLARRRGAGCEIAAATPGATRAGTKAGVHRYAPRWIGLGTNWRRCLKAKEKSSCVIRGKPGTVAIGIILDRSHENRETLLRNRLMGL